MKKSKLLIISSLCLSPLLLLTACVPPQSFSITASSSDSTLGNVYGQYFEEMQEGTKVTLKAVPTEDNTFVCWIKDNKQITSQESELNLSYNNETSGHYTAVFQETQISKMQYASLSGLDFEISGYSKVEFNVSTALVATGSDEYTDFVNGEYVAGQENSIDPSSVIYFGGAGQNLTYTIKVQFKLYDSQNTETTYEYLLNQKISQNTFNDKAGLIVCETISALNDATITFVFNKLTTEEVTDYEKIGCQDQEITN